MRCFVAALAGLMLIATGAAQAKVSITVDKDAQMMTVDVDGVPRYHWPVSTGNPSHETPNGKFQTFRMEASHFSKEFDDAPMPHAIFFTKFGHAIHGTESEGRLGTPVSHGCVRISRANATTLYDLVEKEGVLNTSVTLTGSSQIALARLQSRGNTAVAQRDPSLRAPDGEQYPEGAQYQANQYARAQGYSNAQVYPDPARDGSAGDPVVLTPPRPIPGQYAAQVQRPDDGYIYPADGSSDDGARYPAPRGIGRRVYDAQANSQPQYYDNSGYATQYAPQAYAPRPYYQPRGFFD